MYHVKKKTKQLFINSEILKQVLGVVVPLFSTNHC